MSRPDLSQLDTAGRLRRLFNDSAVYGMAGALNKLIALVTFPLLARQLSVAEYGTVDIFMIATNWLGLVILCGVDSAVARLLLDHPDATERGELLSQAIVWLGLATMVVAPAAWLAAEPLARPLGQEAAARLLAPLVCLQLPFLVISGLVQGVLRWTFQRRRYLVLSLGSSAVSAMLLLATSLATTLRPEHVFVVALAVQATFAMLGLAFVRRWLRVPHSLARWRDIAPIALPLGLIAGAGAALPLVERVLVGGVPGMQPNEAIGLYAAGAKVAGLLSLPILAFQSGWGPFVVALNRETDAARTYNAALTLYAWVIGLTVLALSAVGPWLVTGLASSRYSQAALVVFPLGMALAVQGAGWILEAGITIAKRTHVSLAAQGAMLATFVTLAIWLRGPFGVAGVAFAMLAGQAAFALLSAALAQRTHHIDWQPAPALLMLSLTAAFGAGQCALMAWHGAAAGTVAAVTGLAVLSSMAFWQGSLRRALATAMRRRSERPDTGAP